MADRPMTAEELLKHPEYDHTIWALEPTAAGKLPVAKGRGGPLNIAYEVHGHGKTHLVVCHPCHIRCACMRPLPTRPSENGTSDGLICQHSISSLMYGFSPIRSLAVL